MHGKIAIKAVCSLFIIPILFIILMFMGYSSEDALFVFVSSTLNPVLGVCVIIIVVWAGIKEHKTINMRYKKDGKE